MRNGRLYSRSELYELVWTTPISKLAAEFGITDVALAKKCRKLGVPRPGRGYWARIAHGQAVDRTELPSRMAGQPEHLWITPTTVDHATDPIQMTEAVTYELENLKLQENRLFVSSDFRKAHKLVRQARSILRRAGRDDYGRLDAPWDKQILNVRVSPRTLDRTLFIMDAILVSLERHDFTIKLEEDPWGRHTVISRGGVKMFLSAFERSNQVERKKVGQQKEISWFDYHRYDYAPSGKIEIRLERWPLNRRRWIDLKGTILEDRITEIVREIIESAESLRIELDRRQQMEALQAEERRQAEHKRLLQITESELRAELVQHSVDWATAKRIREYMAATEKTPFTRNSGSNDERSKWRKWAAECADTIDPLNNGAFEDLARRVGSSPELNLIRMKER